MTVKVAEKQNYQNTETPVVKEQPRREDTPAVIHHTAVIGANVELGRGVRIGPKVVIDDHARIGSNCRLQAGVYIGARCQLGEDCVVEPHATILDGCILGSRVRVHSGAVIGSDGFGFALGEGGRRHKIPQVGIVEVGDDAVVGSNATIDRATLGRTIIGRGAVVEAMVQIAHNVRVGDKSTIGCQSGICGSSTIGSSVTIGNNVGVIGHIKVSDGTRVERFSGVSKNIPENSHIMGYPALSPERDAHRREMLQSLPELYERVREIEKAMNGKLKKPE